MSIVNVGIDLAKNVFAVHGNQRCVQARAGAPERQPREAVQRPSMRFVPVKSLEQQSQLMLHRARQGFVEARTATLNRIRGLLSEFGVVLPLKAEVVRRQAMEQLEALPGWANTVIGDLLSEVHRLDERVAQYDRHIA